MLKYKKLSVIMVLLVSILFTGCSERLILVPQSQDYPIFPTDQFSLSKEVEIDVWLEEEEDEKYVVMDETDYVKLLTSIKRLRSEYNFLLKEVNIFNVRIHHLNQIQREKQPEEVKKIDFNLYK